MHWRKPNFNRILCIDRVISILLMLTYFRSTTQITRTITGIIHPCNKTRFNPRIMVWILIPSFTTVDLLVTTSRTITGKLRVFPEFIKKATQFLHFISTHSKTVFMYAGKCVNDCVIRDNMHLLIRIICIALHTKPNQK